MRGKNSANIRFLSLMNVYVASQLENIGPVREAFRALESAGHRVTHDWTTGPAQVEGLSGPVLDAKLREFAKLDWAGVESAGAVLVLNHPGACSTFTEMGLALAWRKVVVVLGAALDGYPRNVFFNLPEVMRARSLEHAIELIGFAANNSQGACR